MGVMPSSGQFALSTIETVLGITSGTQNDINNASFRLLASLGNNDVVLPSGSQIKWSDFFGKGVLSLSNSGTTTNYNVRTSANSGGYGSTYNAGKTLVIFTNSGTIGSSSTGSYACTSGSFSSGDKLQINNSGYIVGAGGPGGNGGSAYGAGNTIDNGVAGGCSFPGVNTVINRTDGTGGGPALTVGFYPTYINNTGTIGGGGNGGRGGDGACIGTPGFYGGYAGGGGGGGAGYGAGSGGGGATGWHFTTGGLGTPSNYCYLSTPPDNITGSGTGGSLTSGGPGASGALPGLQGGNGGDLGGGAAVSGNSNIVWVATGTRLGSVG